MPRKEGVTDIACHSDLIEKLGGPTKVAAMVSDHLGLTGKDRFRPQAASQWKRRGIPYAYRAKLALAAGEKGIDVPDNFFNEQGAVETADASV